jgi:hypothetical protein
MLTAFSRFIFTGEDATASTLRINHMIERILRSDQCKYLNSKGLWPSAWVEGEGGGAAESKTEEGEVERDGEWGEDEEDDDDDMGELRRNPNRQQFSDSDSEDDADDGFKF